MRLKITSEVALLKSNQKIEWESMFNSIVVRKNPALFLTAAVAVVIILLLLVRSVSAASGNNASPNNQGNQQVPAQITQMQQQIFDFQTNVSARLDTLDATLLALDNQIADHDSDVGSLIGTETDEVDGAIADLSVSLADHDAANAAQATEVAANLNTTLSDIQVGADGNINPNPFSVTVNTCATLSGGGQFGGAISGGTERGAKGSLGAVAGGNGVKGESSLQGSLMAKLALMGGVEIAHTACNAGILETSSINEEDYSANQQNTIYDYENVASAL